METIKTFEDACKALKIDPKTVIPEFPNFFGKEKTAMQAHTKLIIIAKALNGDWIPDWTNWDEGKYYPWFEMGSPSGSGFSFSAYVHWHSYSNCGSRLCYKSRELAEYAGKQFEDLYKEYFVK